MHSGGKQHLVSDVRGWPVSVKVREEESLFGSDGQHCKLQDKRGGWAPRCMPES